MIVYRDQRRPADPIRELAEVRREAARMARAVAVDHDDVVALLIAFGEIEAGIVDALSPNEDGDDPLRQVLRSASVACGHLLAATWRGDVIAARHWSAHVDAALGDSVLAALPSRISISVPEGYAHYGLYPETYLAAATRFVREMRPHRCVVIGLRSIGTSLSGIVAAVLQASGCAVLTVTVRPRGAPSERRLRVAASWEGALGEWRDAWFVVVDEGPGLSGSSMASAARYVRDRGIPADRIVLFPSSAPDVSRLSSPAARECWRRHRCFVASFDDVWGDSGRLAAPLPAARLYDISAGRWRTLCCASAADHPAVQPQHERRKYIVVDRAGRDPLWLEFVGLGSYGRTASARAARLAAAGIGVRPMQLRNGFLLRRCIAGTPLQRRTLSPRVLTAAAAYLATVRGEFATARPIPLDDMVEMVTVNVREALGEPWADRLGDLTACAAISGGRHATELDGRMLIHEWLATPTGYAKTDALSHHDDHFFPGPHDIAWDVAAATIELARNAAEAVQLVDVYAMRSGDRDVVSRLPFYRLAYLAFRVGYAALAARTLAGSSDGQRFTAMQARYAMLLRTQIAAGAWQPPVMRAAS